jgi:hypothetical protein
MDYEPGSDAPRRASGGDADARFVSAVYGAFRQARVDGHPASSPDDLAPGMAGRGAIQVFVNCCNTGADRLFVTESWLTLRLPALRDALSDPITDIEAHALRLAVTKARHLGDVITFLKAQPLTWEAYDEMKRNLRAAHDCASMERGLFPWPVIIQALNDEALQASHESAAGLQQHRADCRPCPGCGCGPSDMRWVWVRYSTIRFLRGCAFEGWVVLCRPCGLQVERFGRYTMA